MVHKMGCGEQRCNCSVQRPFWGLTRVSSSILSRTESLVAGGRYPNDSNSTIPVVDDIRSGAAEAESGEEPSFELLVSLVKEKIDRCSCGDVDSGEKVVVGSDTTSSDI